MCENEYDGYYFDTYTQQYILRTDLSTPLEDDLILLPSVNKTKK